MNETPDEFEEVRAIEVYTNDCGDVVIRQRERFGDADDAFIYDEFSSICIRPEHVRAVVKAMTAEAAKLLKAPACQILTFPVKTDEPVKSDEEASA